MMGFSLRTQLQCGKSSHFLNVNKAIGTGKVQIYFFYFYFFHKTRRPLKILIRLIISKIEILYSILNYSNNKHITNIILKCTN